MQSIPDNPHRKTDRKSGVAFDEMPVRRCLFLLNIINNLFMSEAETWAFFFNRHYFLEM